MTHLKCNVTECISNKGEYCCRPEIKVGGKEANCAEQTCCSSYEPKQQGVQNRSGYDYDQANEALEVRCIAHKCAYNNLGKCEASSIHIGCQTSGTRETECCTFQCSH